MAQNNKLLPPAVYYRVSDALTMLFISMWVIAFGSLLGLFGGNGGFGVVLIGSLFGIIGIHGLRGALRLVAPEESEEVLEQEAPREKLAHTVREVAPAPVAQRHTEERTPKEKKKPAEPLIQIDWEEWVGKKLLQKAGILIVLIGMLVLLKYSFDNRWIDELGRVFLSVLGASVLMVCGEYFHKKYPQWSHAFTGGGLALLYLTVWVAHVFYDTALATKYGIVIPASLALVLYSAITVVGAIAAIRYKAQIIAWFTVLGGYLTPILIDSVTPDFTALTIYLVILAGGMLLLAWHQKWKHLNTAAFVLTNFYLFSSIYLADTAFSDIRQVLTASGFFLLFNCIPLLHQFRLKLKADGEDLGIIILNGLAVFFPVVDALGGWGGNYVGLVCLILAAFYLLFAGAALHNRSDDDALVNTFIVGSIVLIAGAMFAEMEREWVALGWAPLSALVMAMCTRVQRRGPWVMSLLLLAGSLFFLVLNMPVFTATAESLWHPFTSDWSIQSYVVFASVIAWIALSKKLPQSLVPANDKPVLINTLHIIVAAILVIAVTFEATRLDFVVDLPWTAAFVGLSVAAILIFLFTENLVWFATAFLVQIFVLLFIFVLGDTSGMTLHHEEAIRPFLHPWGLLSLCALLGTGAMIAVAKVKRGTYVSTVPMHVLFIALAMAQVWVHVSVEITNLATANEWTSIFYERALSTWWVLYAAVVLGIGMQKKNEKLRQVGMVLLFIPFLYNHAAIVDGGSRMPETMVWTGLALITAIVGSKKKFKEMFMGGLLLIGLAAGIDMLAHLGDNSAGLLRSIWWALAGLATMIAGFQTREKQLRQLSMVIFGATVLKLLFIDFSELETPVRIGASIVTGLLLIGASYLYQRFDTSSSSK